MKRFVLTCCLILMSVYGNAQPGPFRPERLSDEEIIRMQMDDIVSWLGLEGKTKDRFVKEYSSFRKEIDAVARYARPPKEKDDETAIDKAIRKNFEVSEQILQIRKKYYSRFQEFLKPSQIQEMYHIENEAGRRKHDGPGGPGGPGGPSGPEGPGRPDGRPAPRQHGGRYE